MSVSQAHRSQLDDSVAQLGPGSWHRGSACRSRPPGASCPMPLSQKEKSLVIRSKSQPGLEEVEVEGGVGDRGKPVQEIGQIPSHDPCRHHEALGPAEVKLVPGRTLAGAASRALQKGGDLRHHALPDLPDGREAEQVDGRQLFRQGLLLERFRDPQGRSRCITRAGQTAGTGSYSSWVW